MMEKEYLDEYRSKIFNLTEEERKFRDEYLLKMYNGIIQIENGLLDIIMKINVILI